MPFDRIEPMSTAPQVLLVDDHELVRVGVKSAVTEVRGVAVRWLEAATLTGRG